MKKYALFGHFHLRQKNFIEKKLKNIYIFKPLEVKHMRNISNGSHFALFRPEEKTIIKQNPNPDPELSFIWPKMFLFHKFLLNSQTKLNHRSESRQLMQNFANLQNVLQYVNFLEVMRTKRNCTGL